MKRFVLIRWAATLMLLGTVGFVVESAGGAEFRADDEAVVEADEVIDDDLYIFGDDVTIDGTVKGDLVVCARVLRVNGEVEGDLIAAGQAIVINGKIGDDVRLAAQVLKVDEKASVGDDLIAAGFSVETLELSRIDGDLIWAGYQALVAGEIGGTFDGGLANCEISGRVEGDVDLAVDGDAAGANTYVRGSPPPIAMPTVPPGLTIADSAEIGGALKYQSPQEAVIGSEAKIAGEVEYDVRSVEQQEVDASESAMSVVRSSVGLLIIGLLACVLAPTRTRQLSQNIRQRPFASLGLGVVGIVGIIFGLLLVVALSILLAVILGFISLSNLTPAVLILGLTSSGAGAVGFWFYTAYLAKVVAAIFIGGCLLGLLNAKLGENLVFSLLVGLILLALLSLVPYLGAIVGWLVYLLAVGSLCYMLLFGVEEPAGSRTPQKPAVAA